ncbi:MULTISPECIES: type II secretion system protein GspL [unclassified Luteimonas]|uniref:type II secretion system protein GspL n=1 Tax=unclassified Luteimonas TaxID=2629088 RepID=UPI0015FF6040|nr:MULTISPECIES: type II secretion system protein GspL [unclassified Luteimonas]MBB1472433.1 type II secretion system protein GspL [Luteimonas sp. MC1782]MBB6598855.1 type II secretion system protein GspL [Luteimonas sp. MC1825]QOC89007.1 type II secretion system protein GspL [Luteimonas sp. MC1825]
MSTRILWLPADPLAHATCFHLDDAGRVLARATLAPDAPPDPPAFSAAPRTVLVVPGADVRVDWLELPARSAAQALGAARALLATRLAHPADLHVALAPDDGQATRMVAAVDPRHLLDWLARAMAFGMRADAVVPEQLLLPAAPGGACDSDDHGACVFDAGDRWLVRGAALAFSAEPALAARVLAGRAHQVLPADDIATLAARALQPDIDLLQGAFAPPATRARPANRRRMAWLVAALLASPLLLVAAQALRLELAARDLQQRAAATVQRVLPRNGDGSAAARTDPATLRAHLDAARAPLAFSAATGALFAAVASRPGTYLTALDYQRGDRLRASLFHATPDDLDAIRGALAVDGWQLVEGTGSDAPGGLLTGITLEPGA